MKLNCYCTNCDVYKKIVRINISSSGGMKISMECGHHVHFQLKDKKGFKKRVKKKNRNRKKDSRKIGDKK